MVSVNNASHGGGIYNDGTLNVQNGSVISANTVTINGGGIYSWGTLNILSSTIGGIGWGNTADQDGGGIFNAAGPTTLDDSSVSGNTAVNGGGIYNASTLYIQNNSIIGGVGGGNTASSDGGGIYNSANATTLDNSMVMANTAENGGGIYNWASLIVQNGSTIGGFGAGNTASINGGGIYQYSAGTSTVTGSRILFNLAANGGGVYSNQNTSAATSVTGSCIVGNSLTAFFNNQTSQQTATGNWWGAATGPNTPGADTVGGNVDTSGYLTTIILGCPYIVYLPLILK
jgi:hypothetical protein